MTLDYIRLGLKIRCKTVPYLEGEVIRILGSIAEIKWINQQGNEWINTWSIKDLLACDGFVDLMDLMKMMPPPKVKKLKKLRIKKRFDLINLE